MISSWKYTENILDSNNDIKPILNNITAMFVEYLAVVSVYIHDSSLNKNKTKTFYVFQK